jgi:hypothetical protein
MAEPRREIINTLPRHSCPGTRRACLYELALGQAIATQHGLGDAGRSDLGACDDCGAPYLLREVWQPHSEEGELACPRCGAIVATWEGARGYVAYWYRDVRIVTAW